MIEKDKKINDSNDKTLEKSINENKYNEFNYKLDKELNKDELENEINSIEQINNENNKDNNNKEENKDKNGGENKNKQDELNNKEYNNNNNEKKYNEENESDDQSNIYINKDKGNKLFSEGDIDGAIKLWSKSINSLSYILNKSRSINNGGVTIDSLNEYTNLYVTLCLNLSLAHLKKEEYNNCKQYCQYVLMYDDKNLKAHLRIVKADLKLNNFKQALINCETGLKYNPDDAELLFLKKSILEQKKKYIQVEKGFYTKAFEKLEPDPRTEEDPIQKLQKSKFFRFNYKLMMFYYNIYIILKKLWKIFINSIYFFFDSIEYIVNFFVNSYNKIKSKIKKD